jgi:O-antigen/teichoic acid export membrane protein
MFTLAVSSFVLTPIFLNELGAKNFGIYTTIYTLSQYVAVGIGWMSGVAILVLGKYNAHGERDKLRAGTSIMNISYSLYGFILFITTLSCAIFTKYNFEIEVSLVLLAFYFVTNYPLQAFLCNLTAINKQSIANLIRALQAFLFFIFTLLAVWYSKTIIAPFFAICITTCLIFGYLLFFGYFKIQDIKNIDKEVISEFFNKVGKWNFLYSFTLLSFGLDVVFLSYFGKAEYAAYYTVIWQIPNFLVLLLAKIPEVSQPYLVRMSTLNDNLVKKQVYLMQKTVVFAAALCIGVLYIYFGKAVIMLWTGLDISNEVYFLLASFAFVCMLIEKVDTAFVFSAGGYKFLFFISLFGLIIKYFTAYYFLDVFREASTIFGYICYFLTMGTILQIYSWRKIK